MRCAALCGCLLVAVFATGCASSPLQLVSGQVTVDGQPLEQGTIDFLAADGNGPTAAALIQDGVYSVEMMPGPKKVIIRGYKVVGQEHASRLDPNSPLVDKKEQFLPPVYSDELKTTLTADIPAGGKPDLDFSLNAAP